MLSFNRIKNKAAVIVITAGVILVVLSLYMSFKWKFEQAEMLQRKGNEPQAACEESIDEETAETAEIAAVPEEEADDNSVVQPTIAQKPDKSIADKPSDKESYINGELVISIPAIKVHAAVVKGTTREMLKKGPGLYEKSPLPDIEGGNVCIAGHRTTYGAWFKNLDKLKKGDEIILEYKEKKYRYSVERVFIVDKKDWSVTETVGYGAITLTACHPRGSARERIVARGKLINDE